MCPYIVVNCKGPNRKTVPVLMHLGQSGKTKDKIEYWMPYPLVIEWPTSSKAQGHLRPRDASQSQWRVSRASIGFTGS